MLEKIAVAAAALCIAGGVAFAQGTDGSGSNGPGSNNNGPGGDNINSPRDRQESRGDDTPSRGSCARTPPHPMCDEARGMTMEDTKWDGTVSAGSALPDTIILSPLESNADVSVAYINGQRVLVDSDSREIIDVLPN